MEEPRLPTISQLRSSFLQHATELLLPEVCAAVTDVKLQHAAHANTCDVTEGGVGGGEGVQDNALVLRRLHVRWGHLPGLHSTSAVSVKVLLLLMTSLLPGFGC